MRRIGGVCSAALVVAGLIAAPAGAHGGGHAVAERARLEQIFPTGVCDYTRGDVGRPPGF